MSTQPSSNRTSSSPAHASSQSTDPAQSIDIRRQNPVPLHASQEAQVRDIYYRNVRRKCANEIREFAYCCRDRTISITWACRQHRLAMNKCMNSFATREEEDKAREEWFQKIPERKKDKEEDDLLKLEQREKWKDWWGLDDQGRRIRPDERTDEKG